MASPIDNRIRSGSPNPGKAREAAGKAQTATPKAVAASGSATSESFTTDRDPSRSNKQPQGPMAGAFVGPGAGKKGPTARNSLLEREQVLSAASNVMEKSSAQGGSSKLSSALAGLFGRRAVANQDPAIKADVATLKATRDSLSGRQDLTVLETETLAVAQRALKFAPKG